MASFSLRGALRASFLAFTALASSLHADPLSKRTEIDFFRDVPSRNLKGLAARADGRLVAGPLLSELAGAVPADLLWCLAAGGESGHWLVGTGPDGKILDVTIDAQRSTFSSRELAKLDESHIFALARLPDGTLLAGTSPKGALCLIRDGKQVARIALPVDSIFDLLVLDDGSRDSQVLVATGNPGRLYKVDIAPFARSGVIADKITDTKILAQHGISLFGEIRDRNIRRVTRLKDGRIIAGSAPRGNIYAFAREGGAPVILQENRDAEVTDLLPSADGSFYATLTYSGGAGETRITPPKGTKESPDTLALISSTPERFGGRSSLEWFPENGFPETLTARNGTAFYRLARQGDMLLVTGGEQGEMLGYDLGERSALTFAGSASSQLNGLAAVPGAPGKYLVLRNNAPGFALLDFTTAAPREAETRRIDLGNPAQLGALRFNRLRDISEPELAVESKVSNGSDEVEGWTPWTSLTQTDGGWSAPDQRGRYVKLRIKIPASTRASLQIDKGALYSLPQNRRPQLQDFHLLSSNFAIVAMPEAPTPAVVSVGQLLQSANSKDDDTKRKNTFLGSQIVPSPGMQVVLWNVVDPDGDNIRCTFSIRRDGDPNWTDLALGTHDSYVQFDTSHLADGVYFTRLSATEAEPRVAAERLTTTFETDDLVVDHTPPDILEASAKHEGTQLRITVQGRDSLSLLEGVEAVFNNGLHEQTEQPLDGIRDGRSETFVLDLPISRVADASSVEVVLYDAMGNTRTKRLQW